FVRSAIGKGEAAKTVGNPLFPLAFVIGVVGVGLASLACRLTLLEFALVLPARSIQQRALTMRQISKPVTFVLVAVDEFHQTFALAFAIDEAPPVLTAVSIAEHALAVGLISHPFAV